MVRYKLDYVAVFHPRPLQCGAWVGERKEVPTYRIFDAFSDGMAQFLVPEILNPYPKLIGAPNRTVHARRLTEVDRAGKEIREVYKWKIPAPIMRGNRQL